MKRVESRVVNGARGYEGEGGKEERAMYSYLMVSLWI